MPDAVGRTLGVSASVVVTDHALWVTLVVLLIICAAVWLVKRL